MLGFLKRFLGDNNDQYIAAYQKVVEKINALEPEMQGLTDDKLTGKTNEFRERLKNGETLDDILPEAFAVVREGSRRVLGMRHFDVQLIGGMCLHDGRIAEMRIAERDRDARHERREEHERRHDGCEAELARREHGTRRRFRRRRRRCR